MAVRIRLQRLGRRNRPFYRVVATDSRSPRNGRALEILGTYNPIETDDAKVAELKPERIEHWLSVGAKPSETVTSLLKRSGIALPWVEREAQKRQEMIEKRREKKGAKPKVRQRRARRAARVAAQPPAEDGEATDVDISSRKAKREAKRIQ